jgi:two-component system sensor histidine kinase KdpD
MMVEERPNPEAILAKIKEEERQKASGKLKVFFGSAPGVGKTHAMLEEALERLAEGIDVVAGIVESHKRKEIEAMLVKFEQIPKRSATYHGKVLTEFDLEKAIARRPAIVLVDELAHTNLPNSKHIKRWEDIKELLEHGIDVYTTLNVQHVESLNDIISQITGVTVKETVPDFILEQANAVELIDLPPDDLLKRLQEGKVYAPEQAEIATKKFFNKGNLIALRELALRMTAERVNAQVLLYRETQSIQKTWPTTEKVLVCIAANAKSAKLIRVAKRMAARFQAKWMAVYVETPRRGKLSEIEKHNLNNNFRLTERLGGEVFTLNNTDIVEEVINFARDHNVTKIIVGKEIRSRLRTFLFGSFVDELIRRSGDVDIYIVQGGYEKSPRLLPIITFRPISTWRSYTFSLAVIAVCTLIGLILHKHVDHAILNMLYLLGVLLIAFRGRYGPAILASFLSIVALNFFYLLPNLAAKITRVHYITNLLVMLFIALIISHVTIVARRQIGMAWLKERRATVLYALSRKLAVARGEEKILQTAARHIGEVFDAHVAILLPDENGHLKIAYSHGVQFTLDEKEQSVAQWVYDLGQVAGLGTKTLPFVRALYVPLLGARSILGVVRVLPIDPNIFLESAELHLAETFANQTALVLESDRGT